MNTSKPVLTISLLASNRPDTIRKCLDSLRPIMKAVVCELILVDTSKSKEIHSILCEYTDQVYEFDWCDDFAKARNVGLKKATGDWFLFLDDDEWFIDAEEIISFFQSGEHKEFGSANYIVRNYMDIHYSTYSDGYVTRMLRIEEDTEFVSKIHEYPTPIRGKRKDLSALVGHSGYIYDTEEKKIAHFERNYALLLEMIEEEPWNVRWKMQLVQELCSVERMAELEEYCKEQIANKDVLGSQYNSEYGNAALGTFYVGYVKGLLEQKKYVECLRGCKKAIEHPQNTKVLKALIHFYLAECNYKLGKFLVAKAEMEEYLSQAKILSQESDLMRVHQMVALVGEAFNEIYLRSAYQRMICIDLKLGNTETLSKNYKWLGLDKKVVVIDEETLLALMEAVEQIGPDEVLIQFMKDAYCNDGLKKALSSQLLAEEKQTMSSFKNIMSVFAEAELNLAEGYLAKTYLKGDTSVLGLYNRRKKALSRICDDMQGEDHETITQVFYDYMVAELEFYLHILGEEGFEQVLEKLPREVQGAAWLNSMFGRKENDVEGMISDLKECALCMPWLAENIKYYVGLLAKRPTANDEMSKLVSAMKEKIIFLLQQGMKQEAKAILQQMRQLVPQEKELEILEREIENE